MKISELSLTEFHQKGWGYEKWIVNGEKYCGKILHFNSVGNKCSMHYHKLKSEHFFCRAGSFLLKLSWNDNVETAEEKVMLVGHIIEIPIGLRHQMIALEDHSELIEISTQHFEDDSYRVAPGDSQK